MKKDKSKIKVKDRIKSYTQASRVEGGIIASVFLLLGLWYSKQSYPIVDSFILIVSVNFIVNAGSIINYVYDIKVDKVAGKDIGFYKYISPKEMILVSLVFSIFGILLLVLINIYSILLGILLFISFFIYAMPPLRLKTKPPLDIVINALGFGSLPFLLGWTSYQNNFLSKIPVYGSIISGLIVISYYLFISSFDIESDREAEAKTSCTKIGFNWTINLGALIFLISFILSALTYETFVIYLITIIICFPVVVFILVKRDLKHIQKSISALYFIWTGYVTAILTFLSKSFLPSLFLILVILIFVMVSIRYIGIENKK